MYITALTQINMKLIIYHIEVRTSLALSKISCSVSPVTNILSSTNNINLQSLDEFIMSFM